MIISLPSYDTNTTNNPFQKHDSNKKVNKSNLTARVTVIDKKSFQLNSITKVNIKELKTNDIVTKSAYLILECLGFESIHKLCVFQSVRSLTTNGWACFWSRRY